MKKSLSFLIAASVATGLFLTASTVSRAEQGVVRHVETAQQLDDIITGNEHVAVDFDATWCGPCRAYAPVFEAVAEKYKDSVVFSKVVLDKIPYKESKKIIKSYKVSHVPKTMLFKDGEEVFNTIGYLSEQELSSLIEKYLLEK